MISQSPQRKALCDSLREPLREPLRSLRLNSEHYIMTILLIDFDGFEFVPSKVISSEPEVTVNSHSHARTSKQRIREYRASRSQCRCARMSRATAIASSL